MPATSVGDVDQLKPHLSVLRALGLRDTDQVAGLAVAAPASLAEVLQVSPAELSRLIGSLPQSPFQVAAGLPVARRLGARTDHLPQLAAAGLSLRIGEKLPPTVNLINAMRPVRDQANRGTCVAHATTALAEHYWSEKGRYGLDLSRQYAYWDCKQHDGIPDQEGTWIYVSVPLLNSNGCPMETTWPYNPNDDAPEESQGPPPDQALAEAGEYRVARHRQLPPTSVVDLKAELADGRPVAFSILVFNSWFANNPAVNRTGEIGVPLPGEAHVGGHAMCMVGYMDEPENSALGGGYFLIRNSWGESWASQSITGHAGYGTIPYIYISRHCMEAFSIG